jgi:hypothetical protein
MEIIVNQKKWIHITYFPANEISFMHTELQYSKRKNWEKERISIIFERQKNTDIYKQTMSAVVWDTTLQVRRSRFRF